MLSLQSRRSQWAQVAIKGHGPAKRAAHARDLLGSFFSQWEKLYVSLDEDRLALYQSKSDLAPFVSIQVNDLVSAKTEQGKAISKDAEKNLKGAFNENLIVRTKYNDEILFRCV